MLPEVQPYKIDPRNKTHVIFDDPLIDLEVYSDENGPVVLPFHDFHGTIIHKSGGGRNEFVHLVFDSEKDAAQALGQLEELKKKHSA